MTFFVCYENENKAIINYLSVNVVISHDHKFKTGKLTYKVVIRDIFNRPSIVWAFSASLIAVYILSHGRCTIIYLLHSYISKLRPHVVLKIQNYLQSQANTNLLFICIYQSSFWVPNDNFENISQIQCVYLMMLKYFWPGSIAFPLLDTN